MDYKKIKSDLTEYDSVRVGIFLNYLKDLANDVDKNGQLKNWWIKDLTETHAVNLFKMVAIDNIYIDGIDVTFAFKGRIMVQYNYQAYKNRLLNVYPETKFDVQLVHRGDEFMFEKKSGNVFYTHKFGNLFERDREIIGVYCIIKNSRGEFIETLNMDEIEKMRRVAKTDNIWKNWFGEMAIKSVLKRACKRHFKDVTQNMDQIDNEINDLSKLDVSEIEVIRKDVLTMIDECQDVEMKETTREIVIDKMQSGEDTVEFYNNIINSLTGNRHE